MAEIRRIETERLIIESTFIVDKSKELVQAIHEAGECGGAVTSIFNITSSRVSVNKINK